MTRVRKEVWRGEGGNAFQASSPSRGIGPLAVFLSLSLSLSLGILVYFSSGHSSSLSAGRLTNSGGDCPGCHRDASFNLSPPCELVPQSMSWLWAGKQHEEAKKKKKEEEGGAGTWLRRTTRRLAQGAQK